MDYKKIFKNPKMRIAILRALDFVPDKLMLKLQYYIQLQRRLNLKKPMRYSEKMQWYKLYYRNELMKKCCDKADVRDYVKECGLEHLLNECYGIYSEAEEISFDEFPESFVVKDTLGGGNTSVVLVENKMNVNISQIKEEAVSWLNEPYRKKHVGREWVYDNKKHRVIVEKLLKDEDEGELTDYKFFCFNGKVFCSYVISMRNSIKNGTSGVLGVFDKDFNLMPVYRDGFTMMKEQPEKPKNYDLMIEYAEILAKPFPHVRVDFYNIGGKIVFGELTFFNASGYVQFDPDEFDFTLGEQFVLPEKSC